MRFDFVSWGHSCQSRANGRLLLRKESPRRSRPPIRNTLTFKKQMKREDVFLKLLRGFERMRGFPPKSARHLPRCRCRTGNEKINDASDCGKECELELKSRYLSWKTKLHRATKNAMCDTCSKMDAGQSPRARRRRVGVLVLQARQNRLPHSSSVI